MKADWHGNTRDHIPKAAVDHKNSAVVIGRDSGSFEEVLRMNPHKVEFPWFAERHMRQQLFNRNVLISLREPQGFEVEVFCDVRCWRADISPSRLIEIRFVQPCRVSRRGLSLSD